MLQCYFFFSFYRTRIKVESEVTNKVIRSGFCQHTPEPDHKWKWSRGHWLELRLLIRLIAAICTSNHYNPPPPSPNHFSHIIIEHGCGVDRSIARLFSSLVHA